MWALRSLGKIKFLRQAVIWFFSIIYRNKSVITISRGPLKGLSWFVKKEHQFWMPLGVYEGQTADWLSSNIGGDDAVLFDIGANAGYFTLLGCRKGAKVIAFDPVQSNVEAISRNLSLNRFDNAIVEQIALSNRNGEAAFVIESNNANSHLANVDITHAKSNMVQQIVIPVMTLDDYCNINSLQPTVIKLDVEGAEVDVLLGADLTIKSKKAKWIISTHGEELFLNCRKIMEAAGYKVESLAGFHHELICNPA